MPQKWSKKELKNRVKELFFHVDVKATGSPCGHVLTARESGHSSESRKALFELLGILAAALASLGVLVCKALANDSSSQLLGVTSAQKIPGTDCDLALFGFCLQAKKKPPDHKESFDYHPDSEISLPIENIDRFLTACEKHLPELIRDYSSPKKLQLETFHVRFTQAGIWVVTDDHPFPMVKTFLFGRQRLSFREKMEVLLWLWKCLHEASLNIQTSAFAHDLLKSFQMGRKRGWVSDDLCVLWQKKFSIPIPEVSPVWTGPEVPPPPLLRERLHDTLS